MGGGEGGIPCGSVMGIGSSTDAVWGWQQRRCVVGMVGALESGRKGSRRMPVQGGGACGGGGGGQQHYHYSNARAVTARAVGTLSEQPALLLRAAPAVPHAPAACAVHAAPAALRYENCEMRTVVLCDGGGGGLADMTWFPGGHAYSEPQVGRVLCLLRLFVVVGGEGLATGCRRAVPNGLAVVPGGREWSVFLLHCCKRSTK